MKENLKILFSVALLSILIAISSVFIGVYGYRDGVLLNIFSEWEIFAYNFALLFFVLWILTYALKSLRWSFFIVSVLVNSGAFVNYVKIFYRQEPFMARDFKIVMEAFNMSQKYDLNLNSANGYIFIGSIVVSFVIFLMLKKVHYRYDHRILKVVLPSLVFAFFLKEYVFDSATYKKLGEKSGLSPWVEVECFQSKGFIYPFTYSIKNSMPYKYKNFNKREAQKLYGRYKREEIPEDKKINLVVVMLESFKDFYKLQNEKLQFTSNPYEYFYQLKEEGISGNLLVNSFGGGTFLTETNVISGYKHTPIFNRTTQCYPQYFKENGYETLGFHPYIGSFYNRNNIYPNMGFDEFYEFDKTFKDLYEYPPMDNLLYYFMNERFNSSKDPKFMFAVTFQNHGPYPTDKLLYEEPYVLWQEGYDIDDYNYFNNYLNGISESSNSLKILIDNLRASDEPTLFVAFGDHSPSMGKNNSISKMFGLNDSNAELEGIYNLYETPYLIWANDKCKEVLGRDFLGEGRDLEPIFLMSDVFKYIGYPGSEYNQYLQDFSKDVSIMKETFFRIRGEYTHNPSERDKKAIEEFKNFEYYVSNLKIKKAK
ncbi:MAG: sulfatase-like hydrolase/transferase [Peptoniphilus sp.]|nr:sulfatase-like hydrolase/transferase [Peptoniphilus sp.]